MNKTIGLVLLLALFTACDSTRVYEENQEIEAALWAVENQPVFEVAITDTTSSYNLYFNLRNSKSYRYRNLYTFFKTTYPDGSMEKDTLQFILADPGGRWYGEGLSDMVNNQILFRRNFQFPQAGTYRFQVEQAMREASLDGIYDVGLRVERAEK